MGADAPARPRRGGPLNGATEVPPDFAPTFEMRNYASLELGVEYEELKKETDAFIDYHRARHKKFTDWNAR